MLSRRQREYAAVFIAAFPLLLPQSVFAQQPVSQSNAARIFDIELDQDGGLYGQVVAPAGKPQVGKRVRLAQRGELIAATRTDGNGVFRFSRVRGGVHQIVLDEGATVVRCWTQKTAPPSAQKSMLLVTDGKVIRGQHPISHLFTNPVTIALAVVAAIAIPIAINNSDSPPSSP